MMLLPLLLTGVVAAAPPPSQPARPDQGGGMYTFDASDEVVYLDGPEGKVRVHYSISGPSVTLLQDLDGSGYPDFPEEVARTAEGALDTFEDLGFRPPLSEQDMGLTALGGSYAFDFYLVDFALQADGMFSIDSCEAEPNHCSGFMIMENDFAGYGYSSVSSAVRTLTSHELFHAVQMAYESDSPVWYTEGMAVWAERQFDPENEDFLWYAQAYLEDVGRPIDQPPTGPVPAFAYATCLFWQFLGDRLGPQVNLAIQESLEWNGETQDTLTNTLAAIEAAGSDIGTEWRTFATWNQITGRYAGVLESYSFAEELDGVFPMEIEDTLVVDNRFYPLAASYWKLTHPGGPLWFSHTEDGAGLYFALHAVTPGEDIAPLVERTAQWEPGAPAWIQVSEDLPAGAYWLMGTYPANADSSKRLHFCLGDEATALTCLDPEVQDTGEEPGKDEGCQCGALTPARSPWGLGLGLAAAAVVARRRRARRERA